MPQLLSFIHIHVMAGKPPTAEETPSEFGRLVADLPHCQEIRFVGAPTDRVGIANALKKDRWIAAYMRLPIGSRGIK